jgi:hypothetical protein
MDQEMEVPEGARIAAEGGFLFPGRPFLGFAFHARRRKWGGKGLGQEKIGV